MSFDNGRYVTTEGYDYCGPCFAKFILLFPEQLTIHEGTRMEKVVNARRLAESDAVYTDTLERYKRMAIMCETCGECDPNGGG